MLLTLRLAIDLAGRGAAAGLAGAQLRRQIDFDHARYLHPTVGAVAASIKK